MTGIKKPFILLLSLFLWQHNVSVSQDLGEYSKQEIKEFSQQAEEQVRFLQYFLNTVGNRETSARDKDVIIRESYKKIFRDDKVQIEDDLLFDRKVITNKSVTSYLKDIEFFFKDASFEFKIKEIKPKLNDNDELFFEVSLDRTITALGLNNEEIENTKSRYIEINLDRDSNELKIASIYTTKLSRDEELLEWWSTLSLEWERLLRDMYDIVEDSVELDQLYKVSSLDTLDLSANKLIVDLSPIQVFRDLKYVDISNTQIQDLQPISNITFLSYLDISNTPTQDIQFIKYSDKLTYLDISGTNITNIDDLSNLKSLKTFILKDTQLLGFGVLNNLSELEDLNLEMSGFNNIENIKDLPNLRFLNLKGNFLINFGFLSNLTTLEEINLEETNILDLAPLAELPQLWRVNINGTEVNQLGPIDGTSSIRRIYADRTSISENAADEFARRNRRILLIHNVENLQTWWETLPKGWNEVLLEIYPKIGSDKPSIEELTELVNLDSLELASSEVVNLRPALKFKNAVYINIENTKVQDLSPLAEMRTLLSINGNNTEVTNLKALQELNSLTHISFLNTSLETVEPLKSLQSLVYVNLDSTAVPEWEIHELVHLIPETTIIFRSDKLANWWEGLDDNWRRLLGSQFDLSGEPDMASLHNMTAESRLVIKEVDVYDLEPALIFFNLRSLEIANVPLQDPSAISRMELLQKIKITETPFRDLTHLSSLTYLESLDISNTAVEDLRPLSSLGRLKHLNLSGTNIRVLKGLETLYDLRELDIASTSVRNLRPISHLINLEKLVCYNTRLSNRNINNIRKDLPDCEVRFY